MSTLSPEAQAYVAWSAVAEPGDAAAGALVAHLGARQALAWVHSAGQDPSAAGLDLAASAGPDLARASLAAHERWWRRRDSAQAPHVERARAVGARVITRGHDAWPSCLADLGPSEPFALYVRSARDLEQWLPRAWENSVALVGARAASSYGTYLAHRLGADLSGYGRAVMSGGAFGVDAAAHRGALDAGGETIAMMAGGVDRLYPAGNAELLDSVIANGAVISEVPPGFAPHRQRFLARNRLIATAAVTVVVEAAHRSGALSSARHAAELLRPVGAVPGPVTSPSSTGCHALISQHLAELVTDANDVMQLAMTATQYSITHARDGAREQGSGQGALAIEEVSHGAKRQAPDFASASHRALYDVSSSKPRELEELASRAGLSLAQTRAAAGELELEGLLEAVHGKWRRPRGGT